MCNYKNIQNLDSRSWMHSDEASSLVEVFDLEILSFTSDSARFTTGCSSRVTLHGVAWAMANTGVWLRLLEMMQAWIRCDVIVMDCPFEVFVCGASVHVQCNHTDL